MWLGSLGPGEGQDHWYKLDFSLLVNNSITDTSIRINMCEKPSCERFGIHMNGREDYQSPFARELCQGSCQTKDIHPKTREQSQTLCFKEENHGHYCYENTRHTPGKCVGNGTNGTTDDAACNTLMDNYLPGNADGCNANGCWDPVDRSGMEAQCNDDLTAGACSAKATEGCCTWTGWGNSEVLDDDDLGGKGMDLPVCKWTDKDSYSDRFLALAYLWEMDAACDRLPGTYTTAAACVLAANGACVGKVGGDDTACGALTASGATVCAADRAVGSDASNGSCKWVANNWEGKDPCDSDANVRVRAFAGPDADGPSGQDCQNRPYLNVYAPTNKQYWIQVTGQRRCWPQAEIVLFQSHLFQHRSLVFIFSLPVKSLLNEAFISVFNVA